MYSKLVLEVDRRVRLVANQVHALITANAKKKLAPLLKGFIGPWLLSMNDQSKDIVRVAQNAFEVFDILLLYQLRLIPLKKIVCICS